MYSVVLEPVHIDNVFRDIQIRLLVAFIQHNEEQVETTHDGGGHSDVRAKGLLAVVAATDRIRRSKNGGTRVQRGMDAGFGNRDRLLFHGFVNGNLVGNVHLVELVDSADTVVSQHESTSFDGEVASLFVFHYGSRQTGRR